MPNVYAEQGIEQGIEQGQRLLARHILERQFGPLPEALTEKLQTLDAGGIEELLDIALNCTTLEELTSEWRM
jgi:hypothetical protein